MVVSGVTIAISAAGVVNTSAARRIPGGFGVGLALIVLGCLLAAAGGYVSALMASQKSSTQNPPEAQAATAKTAIAEQG